MSTCSTDVETRSITATDASPEDGLGAMEPFAATRPARLALLGGVPAGEAGAFTICPWTTVSLA